MAVDVAQAIQSLIQRIISDEGAAMQYAEDPEGTLAAQGITDADKSGLDMFQVVRDCNVPGLQNYGPSSGGGGASGGGASGGGGAPTPPPASSTGATTEQVMQHLNYVTYETYESNETIVQNITDNSTEIDQSQNVEVHGDVEGDLDVDSHDTNVNATGDGAVAAGDDVKGAATGDGAVAGGENAVGATGDGSAASGTGPATVGDGNVVNTGTNFGQQNTGDQAAQAQQVGFGRGEEGGGIVQNTGDGGVAAGDDINAPVNTGEFTGVQGENVAINDAAVGFGEGDVSNVSELDAEEGGAISLGGDATGNKVDADESVVQTEQGSGNATQENVDNVPIDVEIDASDAPPILPKQVEAPLEEASEEPLEL